MGKYTRDFFGRYYATPFDKPKHLMGCEYLHAVPRGAFTAPDGTKKSFTFIQMCTDELPDTHGKYQESFDLAAIDADAIINSAEFTSASESIDLSIFAPTTQQLIISDIQEGLDVWEIMTKRIAVMVTHCLGKTFDEVLLRYPWIWQPSADEYGNEVPNIYKCSLETL